VSVRSLLCLMAAFTALAGLATRSVAQHEPSVTLAPVLDASTIITLERGPCVGRCSQYALRINGLGEVVFDGRYLVCAKGRQTARAPRDEIRRLVLEMVSRGYFDLAWPAGPITTAQPTVITSLRHTGRVREVKHNLGDVNAPLWLKTLEERIDGIAGTSRWLPDREDHRPMCNREDGVRIPLEP
jgi:hypothetical protein